jgi:hypothetical protein
MFSERGASSLNRDVPLEEPEWNQGKLMTDNHAEHGALNGGMRHGGMKPTPMSAAHGGRPIGRMLLAVGAMLVAGLAITLVVIRAQAPAHEGRPPSADNLVPPVQTASATDVIPVEEVAPPPVPEPERAPVQKPAPKGPSGVITVPSAGLRSAPSLDAKMTATVVKERERVMILQRRASSSGPDWIQVRTSAGKSGWVWASVVKQRGAM